MRRKERKGKGKKGRGAMLSADTKKSESETERGTKLIQGAQTMGRWGKKNKRKVRGGCVVNMSRLAFVCWLEQ